MYKTKTSSKKSWLLPLTIIAIFIVIAGGYGLIQALNRADSWKQPTSATNFSPPTEEEKTAGDEKKQEIIEKDGSPEPANPSIAEVVIVDAGQYNDQIEVRAFVANAFQDGRCIFTFSQDSATITKETAAFKDATTTQCTPLTVPRTDFSSDGVWTVAVQFESTSLSGKNNREFTIK